MNIPDKKQLWAVGAAILVMVVFLVFNVLFSVQNEIIKTAILFLLAIILVVGLGALFISFNLITRKQISLTEVKEEESIVRGMLELRETIEEAKKALVREDQPYAVGLYTKAMNIYEWLAKRELDDKQAKTIYMELEQLRKEIEKTEK